MPKMMITKQAGSANISDDIQLSGLSGSIGICEFIALDHMTGIEEFLSENKIEGFQTPVGGRFHCFDSEWEHQLKTGNPDDFPAPQDTISHEAAGGWNNFFGVSMVGRGGGDYNTLYTQNYDMDEDNASCSCYILGNPPATSARGPGGFNISDQGVCRIGQETCHYGSISDTGVSAIARMWGSPGPPYIGLFHPGHDYVANPFPPPDTILSRQHDAIDILYPPRWVNHWMASSRHVETNVPMPVKYSPKGSKCGVFMPIILRFLAFRRRRAKSASSGVVNINPVIG